MEEGTKLKPQFITSDELWEKVLKYKSDTGLKNNNIAVEELIKKALEQNKYYKDIVSEHSIPQDTVTEMEEFRNNIPTYEKLKSLPLSIFLDKKSGAFYTECHILSSDFIKYSDQDAVIDLADPELQEEERANREIEEENFYFIQMVEDANKGRSFSDMIVEYDTSYKQDKPMKILGGQHRDEAIKRATKTYNINVYHGVKVYFNLNKDQKVEIMRIANTNINVADDLRDRLQEETLSPIGMLKEFAKSTRILEEDENFSDKRRYEAEFSPSVRMIRSFIVNFFKGKEYSGEDIDKDAVEPYLCKSGKDIDKEYLKYFNKFKTSGKFDDQKLIEAGERFAKLHNKQYEKAENINSRAKKEYKIKSFSLAIISSWAYCSGALQKYPQRLEKFYSLPDLSGNDDPLNAIAMANAKHGVLDRDKNYRGLGTRSDTTERGRLLHLFLGYSLSPKPKITEQMCNNAIEIFHSNKDRIKAEENKKKAFG